MYAAGETLIMTKAVKHLAVVSIIMNHTQMYVAMELLIAKLEKQLVVVPKVTTLIGMSAVVELLIEKA